MTLIAAGLSTEPTSEAAAQEAAGRARAELGDAPVDLALVFFSPAHLEDAEAIADGVRGVLSPRHLVGCAAQGVIAGDEELEEGPGTAVWAGSLPGAGIECFHASALETDTGIGITGFPTVDQPSLVLLLVDPFSFPAAGLLAHLNSDNPGLPLVGGIAVAGSEPGVHALIVDDDIHREGAVGAILAGVSVRTVVSQGCAPIGRDAVITQAEENVVVELAGEPALERLREEIASLPPAEQQLAARGLLAGLVIDENKPEYGRGDFLIRGLLGADDDTGALHIGETVRVGQTLRFHVRDSASAAEDLRLALDEAVTPEHAAGALLFTCNGRGTNMFSEPSHDARLVTGALGSLALAGFFCGGEIGPVGSQTFVHGFTATMAVFLTDDPESRRSASRA